MTLTKEEQEIMSAVVLNNDVCKLSPQQRVAYVKQVCDRIGIDWSTQPFQILKLNGKERLYATKDCTEQLRKVHGVSIVKLEKTIESGLCIFNAYAEDKNGKKDASTGAVPIEGLKGENLANAIMKAETKAKRRVTLSICGLGMLDESEVGSIEGAQTKNINETFEAQHTEVKAETKPETKIEHVEQKADERSIDDLHREFMLIWNEYLSLYGDRAAAPYHPDNWKTERSVKAYVAAIPTMEAKVKLAKARKEFANG